MCDQCWVLVKAFLSKSYMTLPFVWVGEQFM